MNQVERRVGKHESYCHEYLRITKTFRWEAEAQWGRRVCELETRQLWLRLHLLHES